MTINQGRAVVTTGVKSIQNTAVERHVMFWDRRNKGYITPLDAAAGLMNLGYGIFFSLTIGSFLSIVFSYMEQDSWVPQVPFKIDSKKLACSKRVLLNDEAYDEDGNFDPDRFDVLYRTYASDSRRITLLELLQMTNEHASLGDHPVAWTKAVAEWFVIYMFIGKSGAFSKDDVQATYDGSLFYRMRDAKRPAIQSKEDQQQKWPWLKSALSQVEHKASSSNILNGIAVATPAPPRSRAIMKKKDSSMSLTGVRSDEFEASSQLSGVKSDWDNSSSIQLSGVKGYHSSQDNLTGVLRSESTTDSFSEDKVNDWLQSDLLSESLTLTGLNMSSPTPAKNWLATRQLPGVLASSGPAAYETIDSDEIPTDYIDKSVAEEGDFTGLTGVLASSEDWSDSSVESSPNMEEESAAARYDNVHVTGTTDIEGYHHSTPLADVEPIGFDKSKDMKTSDAANNLVPQNEHWPMLADATDRGDKVAF